MLLDFFVVALLVLHSLDMLPACWEPGYLSRYLFSTWLTGLFTVRSFQPKIAAG